MTERPRKVSRRSLSTAGRDHLLGTIRDGRYHQSIARHDIGYWCERDFVLEAVALDGNLLKFASPPLRGVREVVSAAIVGGHYTPGSRRRRPPALQHASVELRNDKEIVLLAVEATGANFRYASEVLRNDREVVWTAVTKGGLPLCDIPATFRSDRDIVLHAVTEHGCPLEWVAPEMLGDREIMMAAAIRNPTVLALASDVLLSDKKFAMEIVSHDGNALYYLSEKFLEDTEVVVKAIQYGGLSFEEAEDLHSNRDIVLALVSEDGSHLRFASEALRCDREVVMAASTNNAPALQHVSNKDELFGDLDFVASLIRSTHDGDAMRGTQDFWEIKLNYLFFHWTLELSSLLDTVMQQDFAVVSLENGTATTPVLWAGTWLDHLVQTRWCVSQALPPDCSRQVSEFLGLQEQYQLLLRWRDYSPVFGASTDPHRPWQQQAQDFVEWCASDYAVAPARFRVGLLMKEEEEEEEDE